MTRPPSERDNVEALRLQFRALHLGIAFLVGFISGELLIVHADLRAVRWRDVRDRIFGRIDPIEGGGRAYRKSLSNVDVFEASARFVAPCVVEAGGSLLTSDRIVVAAGARPMVPSIPGLADVPFHTSDTIMRIIMTASASS